MTGAGFRGSLLNVTDREQADNKEQIEKPITEATLIVNVLLS